MKKIFTLGLISLLSLSCSKEDESTTTGTYILTSITTDDALDFNNDGVSSKNFILESGCPSDSKIILSENGSLIYQLQIAEVNLNNPGAVTNSYTSNCIEPSAFPGTWIEAGPNLIFTIENSSEEFIKNGNTISFYGPDFIEYLENTNGTTVINSTGATVVFTKI
jgi:hypothetical protein